MKTVRIDCRFRGPPHSGNGGYFAGLLARQLGGSDVTVTLHKPAPLDTELRVECEVDRATMYDGETVLAVAERSPVVIEVPRPPSLEEAADAERRFRADRHLYPGCFVCGPERSKDDGWRIFPGVSGTGRVAAQWTPSPEFADEAGKLLPEFVWAALDCPGYFAVEEAAGLALLGRIEVHLHGPVPTGEAVIVSGWAIGSDGRKHRAGTALHDASGRLLAAASQIWISLR